MELFQWLSRKPPRTALEQFCRQASLAKVVRAIEEEPNARGLAHAQVWLLLCTAYLFLEKAYEEKVVGKGPGLVSPNVVLFEVVTFLSSAVETPLTEWVQSELGLQGEHEICVTISAAKDVVLARMSERWPNVSLNAYASKRIYPDGRLDDAASMLADWLCSSTGLDVPAPSRNKSSDIGALPMTKFCPVFAANMVPAVVETLQRKVEVVLRPPAPKKSTSIWSRF
jgi:hypothetical protein